MDVSPQDNSFNIDRRVSLDSESLSTLSRSNSIGDWNYGTQHRAGYRPRWLQGKNQSRRKYGACLSSTSWFEKAPHAPRALLLCLALSGLIIIALSASLVYYNVHLRGLIPKNDIQRIVASWGTPGTITAPQARWPTDFSRNIIPIPCHSHNDYWRKVPLYDAIAAGCMSVEADVWLDTRQQELYVGHSEKPLTSERTLRSFYINPLLAILSHQNNLDSHLTESPTTPHGVFDTSPHTPLILLIDLKTDGHSTFPIVQEQFEPLRDRGWLTSTNGTHITPGLVTVVGTGNTPFDLLVANQTYRDIFFDAPLGDLWPGERGPGNTSLYTAQNSYYASVSFGEAIGKPWLGRLSPRQVDLIEGQVAMAKAKGLKARYWDTPSWPVSLRNHVWDVLEKKGVGMLNVDDLVAASRRDWNT